MTTAADKKFDEYKDSDLGAGIVASASYRAALYGCTDMSRVDEIARRLFCAGHAAAFTLPGSPGFVNHSSKRLWTEEECRAMLNAALLYLAHKNGGRLDISTVELFKACEQMGTVAMALSDDDKVLTITGMGRI
jgi:hypothetical protein